MTTAMLESTSLCTSSPCDENRRILLVDDNVAIHEDYRKILVGRGSNSELAALEAALFDAAPLSDKRLNYEVSSAYQGQEALSQVLQAVESGQPFAMAFVDMRMPPGWNGVETIKRIWEVDPNIQIVICSAYSDHSWSDLVAALPSVGQWLLLRKPFDSAEVSQLALALTQKWELERQARDRVQDLERIVAERTHDLREEMQSRLAAQVALRENDARIRAVFDTTQNGIVIFDEAGKLECANRAACQMFGFAESELPLKNIAELIVGPDGQPLADADPTTRGATLADRAGKHPECLVRSQDHPGMAVSVKVSCFISCSQRMYAALLQDLSSFKRLQSEVAQASKLQAAGQLAAGVAQEINMPLQHLAANNEFFEECFDTLRQLKGKLDDLADPRSDSADGTLSEIRRLTHELGVDHLLAELPNALQDSTDGVRRVREIVNSMRLVSHLHDEATSDLDLSLLLQESIAEARRLEAGTVDIVTDFADDLPTFKGLASRLRDAFTHLVANALEATAAAGSVDETRRVRISTAVNNGWVEVSIADNGCGIPEAIREKVYDPFFTTKACGDGRGQGLAIAWTTIVDGHQGEIAFSSQEGQGTTFTIRLPQSAAVTGRQRGAQLVGA